MPADARLIEVADLGVREAALTGEAEAVFKRADLVLEPNTPVLERRNCLFQGTEVVRGRGVAVVSATGMGTELGQIAALINTAESGSTPLQERLDGLANVLVGSALALVASVVLIGWWMGQSLLNLLEVSLSMAVAIVPEGLPAVITVTLAIGTQRMVRRAALIRRLPAVEGLGSVTVICSDKTGTLTQNRQVVQELRLGTTAVGVSGQGYDPDGRFTAGELSTPRRSRGRGSRSGCRSCCSRPGCSAATPSTSRAPMATGRSSETHRGCPLRGGGQGGDRRLRAAQPLPPPRRDSFSSERQLMAVWIDDPRGELQAPLGDAAAGSAAC